jgi:hypothetical protein
VDMMWCVATWSHICYRSQRVGYLACPLTR